jgi:hypothetical protein
MTFVREFGLVHNPSDSERFIRLVKWEGRWRPVANPVLGEGGQWEEFTLTPTVWELARLDVSNPRALNYSGPEWNMVPVVITELPMRHWRTTWPSEAPTETESMRRLRIRELRRSCHVDETKGDAEPTWMPAPAKLQMHNPACDVNAIAGR